MEIIYNFEQVFNLTFILVGKTIRRSELQNKKILEYFRAVDILNIHNTSCRVATFRLTCTWTDETN